MSTSSKLSHEGDAAFREAAATKGGYLTSLSDERLANRFLR